MRRQKCRRGSLVHVYQRAENGFLLFYTARDCLVFFSIFSTQSKKHRLKIVSLCLMPDHLHFCVETESHEDLSGFVDEYSSMYAKAFNGSIEHEGNLFKACFGMANKSKEKSRRSCIIYVLNNPVEKKLSSRAVNYRWNFLRYATEDFPFSQAPSIRMVSRRLRKAFSIVKLYGDKGWHLNHFMLDKLFDGLDSVECEQLVDYVINSFNVIDYEGMVACFRSFDDLVVATDSSTGSEYDIREEKSTFSDKVYLRISRFIMDRCGYKNPKSVLMEDDTEKIRIANMILSTGIATALQVKKYLRM